MVESSFEFGELHDRVVASIERFIAKHKPVITKEERDNPPPIGTNLRLPEIPLPYFDGDYEHWSSYKDEIHMVVINNNALNAAQKLHYLRGSLRGVAANVQSGLDTVESLWDAIVKRFEVPRVIVNNHIDMIHNIKQVKPDSPSELRHLLETTVKSLRLLDMMKLPLDPLAEQLVVNLICNRLDDDTRKALETIHIPTT